MRLISDAKKVATWVLTSPSEDPARREALLRSGVTVINVEPGPEGTVGLDAALAALGERGITRLLVEGGGRLAAALMRARLVDRIAWVHAPMVIGNDGIPAIASFGLDVLADAPRFERLWTEEIGEDLLTVFCTRE
jgi:diaminohydroxyphosphoribosylaminopyrimidine deaminase/5-amino-6-(5-phosphoribosylamino)uracil reductase